MSRNELVELVESIEEGGGDATDLKALLAEVDSDARKRGAGKRFQATTRGLQSTRDEEMTTQEHLEYKVGDLFPEGISGEVLAMLFQMDRDHSLKELKQMCVEVGLSSNGDKKMLAAKLLARQRRTGMDKQVKADNRLEMLNQWRAAPSEELAIPREYVEGLQFEVVVFGRREFTFQCAKCYPTEKETWTFDKVVMDTSTHDPEGNVTEQRVSYYPAMSLVNAAFMIIPAPKPLDNPQEYLARLRFRIVVFGKREFTFCCERYYQALASISKDGVWTFEGAVRDPSKREPQGDVTLKLVNTPFMVLPAPEDAG